MAQMVTIVASLDGHSLFSLNVPLGAQMAPPAPAVAPAAAAPAVAPAAPAAAAAPNLMDIVASIKKKHPDLSEKDALKKALVKFSRLEKKSASPQDKRARSSFILYCMQQRDTAKKSNETAPSPSALSAQWKDMSADDKLPYVEASKLESLNYKKRKLDEAEGSHKKAADEAEEEAEAEATDAAEAPVDEEQEAEQPAKKRKVAKKLKTISV